MMSNTTLKLLVHSPWFLHCSIFFNFIFFFSRLTCPKIFSTGIPWKTRRDISSLTFWLSLLQAMALSMRTWCVQKQTFTRFSNFCKKSLFLLHVVFDDLGGAIYSGSPSDRSPLLLRFPDCNGKHPLWNVQSVDQYLHQRSQREVSYWTCCGSYLGAMMSGAGVRTSADNGSWVLTAQDQWTCGSLVVGCQHENIAFTELPTLSACQISIYFYI